MVLVRKTLMVILTVMDTITNIHITMDMDMVILQMMKNHSLIKYVFIHTL